MPEAISTLLRPRLPLPHKTSSSENSKREPHESEQAESEPHESKPRGKRRKERAQRGRPRNKRKESGPPRLLKTGVIGVRKDLRQRGLNAPRESEKG
jgi:hypothetical protein